MNDDSKQWAVCVRALSKGYGIGLQRIEVLRGLNLRVHAGEKIAIRGASGAGKSTLLHILGTLDSPDEGELLFFDKKPPYDHDERLSQFRNQHIGFVFQFHHLLGEFTAHENVMLPALIAGVSRADAEKKSRNLLNQVGLGERLTHRPSQLSGGEQQRVAIARAVIQNPTVLIADEPTGNLDRENGEKILDLLLTFNREHGMTLLMATHNMDLAKQMDRVLDLRDGRLHE